VITFEPVPGSDQLPALRDALASAAGQTLYIPAGTYDLELPDAEPLIPAANTRIVGDGPATVLRAVPPGPVSDWRLFNLANPGVTLQDFRVEALPVTGDGGQFITLSASNLRLERLELDGGHSPTNQAVVHCLGLGNGAYADGVALLDLEVCNWRYGLLKGNTDTSSQRRIRILGGFWHDNYANHIALNTPTGYINDVLVHGVTFRDCWGGPDYGTYGIMCGCASATNLRITDCFFDGAGKQAIHIEENAKHVVVQGNTCALTDKAAHGIVVLANDVGGTMKTPTYLSLSGNVLRGAGKANATGRAVYIVNAQHCSVADNVIDSWDVGISGPAVLSGNIIDACNS
jgi:hypothetical protein